MERMGERRRRGVGERGEAGDGGEEERRGRRGKGETGKKKFGERGRREIGEEGERILGKREEGNDILHHKQVIVLLMPIHFISYIHMHAYMLHSVPLCTTL